MSKYGNLSREDRAAVNGKIAELQEKTGHSWNFEVTQRPQGSDQHPQLQITIDGRIARPIPLEGDGGNPADRIASELDRHFLRTKSW